MRLRRGGFFRQFQHLHITRLLGVEKPLATGELRQGVDFFAVGRERFPIKILADFHPRRRRFHRGHGRFGIIIQAVFEAMIHALVFQLRQPSGALRPLPFLSHRHAEAAEGVDDIRRPAVRRVFL